MSQRQPVDGTAALAMEVVSQIRPLAEILTAHGLTAQSFQDLLAGSPEFAAQLRSAKAEWESAGNARQRVSVKAAHLLEDSLPEFVGILHDPETGAGTKLNAIKSLQDLTRLNDTKDEAGGNASVFNLIMKFGDREEKVVVGGEQPGELEHADD